MRRVVIKGSEWARGRYTGNGRYLLQGHDGKMCCVGIDGRARGLAAPALLHNEWPSRADVPGDPEWTEYADDWEAGSDASGINDNSDTTDEEKIEALRPIFRNLPHNPAIIVWRPDL